MALWGSGVDWAGEARRARAADLERYQAAWQAYIGDMPDPLPADPKRKADDNTKINYVAVVVDTAVAALFGDDVGFDLAPEANERTPAEQWLDEVWRVNQKMLLLQKAAINGSVYGHVFLKLRAAGGDGFPRLVNLPPEYVTVVGDPDDVDTVLEWVIQYPLVDAAGERMEVRQTIRRNGMQWETVDERRTGNTGWQVVGVEPWGYAWPPIIACQNLPNPNEYYGLPDVGRDVVQLNRSINFVLSNVQRIIRYHAHPKTWARGTNAREFKSDVDDVIVFSSAEAELHTLEMASDLSSSIEYYTRLREALHETTRTPEVATGKLDTTGVLSGVALRILYGPLEAKTKVKRLTYGLMLVELNRRLWEMGGWGDENLCTLVWGAVVPANEMEERQVAVLDEQLGVSKDTILARLGYDPDEEREKRAAQGADAVGALLESLAQGQGAEEQPPQNGRVPERNNL